MPAAHTILFLGIGGAGMRGLAHLRNSQGNEVIGLDGNPKALSDPALAEFDMRTEDSLASALAEADQVIYTDALTADHPWRQAATAAGRPARSLYEAEGEFVKDYRVIAVAGTHGKSSTTGLLAHILLEAGIDLTVRVGAPMPAWDNRNARLGSGEWLLIEADEYQNHFHHFHPEVAVITSIDFDHPDFFASLEAVHQSFSTFLGQVSPAGTVVVPEQVQQRHAAINWPSTTISVSTDDSLPVFGDHMKSNASLALTVAAQLGVSQATAAAALTTWPGIGRRFEQLGVIRDVPVFSDYGHHPAELAATLLAAQERFPDGRLLVLFEPHTVARATQFGEAFSEALKSAAGVIRVPIFRARGEDVSVAAEAALTQALTSQISGLITTDSLEAGVTALQQEVSNYDAVLAFTAGSLDAVLRDFFTQKNA